MYLIFHAELSSACYTSAMSSYESGVTTKPDLLPERRGPFDKKISGIEEIVTKQEIAEEDLPYHKREIAMQSYQDLQAKLIELIDVLKKELSFDADVADILDEIRQFPWKSSPLYAPRNGRSPVDIFTHLPDPRGSRVWSALSKSTFAVGVKRSEAYLADKAVHEKEKHIRERQIKSMTDTADYWNVG